MKKTFGLKGMGEVGPKETVEDLIGVEPLVPLILPAISRVVAKVYFACALLDRSFNPGEEVIGWDDERIARYLGVLVEYQALPVAEK